MDRAYSRRCGASGTALWFLGASLAVLGLGACASDDHPRGRGGPRGEHSGAGPDGAGGPGRPSLFVSPAGEPFRAEPGEAYPVAVWFKGADANGDGKLTKDEFVADAARFFARLDVNKDGVIDGFELKVYETQIVPEITEERGGGPPGGGAQSGAFRQGGGGRGGGGGGSRGGGRRGGGGFGGQGAPGGGQGQSTPQASGAGPYDLLGEREPVAGADLDLNSRITLANFRRRAEQRFALLDKDGQGYLLLAELPKTQVQRQADRRQGRRDAQPPGQ